MNLGYRAGPADRRRADRPRRTTRSAGTVPLLALVEAGEDEPLAELFDGQGNPLGPPAPRRGRVTGTFFHAIAGQ